MAGLVATATDVEMKSSSSPSSSSSISASVWAGFLGGLVGTVVSYPFDTLRVVSQTSSFSEGSRGSNYKALPSTGLWQSYRNMQSRNLSLYSGIGPAMMSQGLLYGFLFGTKIGFENILISSGWSSNSDLNVLGRSFIAGIGTGIASAPLTSPLELWKIRLQTSQSGNNSKAPFSLPKSNATILSKTDLFKGLPATALRCAVGNSAFFSYLTLSELTRSRNNNGHTSIQDSAFLDAINGGISGIVYWVVCMPFDVIKTRQQARISKMHTHSQPCHSGAISSSSSSSTVALGMSSSSAVSSPSIIQEAASIIRIEGYGGLWRGFSLAMYRTIPLQASIYCVYKFCM